MTTPRIGQVHVTPLGDVPRYCIVLGVETTYSYNNLRRVVRCLNVFIQSWPEYCSYEYTVPLDYIMSKYSPHD